MLFSWDRYSTNSVPFNLMVRRGEQPASGKCGVETGGSRAKKFFGNEEKKMPCN